MLVNGERNGVVVSTTYLPVVSKGGGGVVLPRVPTANFVREICEYNELHPHEEQSAIMPHFRESGIFKSLSLTEEEYRIKATFKHPRGITRSSPR